MIPEGWTIKREQNNELFKSITITAPNGYAAYVSNIERNPANILYMLAEALLEQPLTQVSGEYGYPKVDPPAATWTPGVYAKNIEKEEVFCGYGCHCLTVCGDYYEHLGQPKPPGKGD